jgi:hypothetical protein
VTRDASRGDPAARRQRDRPRQTITQAATDCPRLRVDPVRGHPLNDLRVIAVGPTARSTRSRNSRSPPLAGALIRDLPRLGDPALIGPAQAQRDVLLPALATERDRHHQLLAVARDVQLAARGNVPLGLARQRHHERAPAAEELMQAKREHREPVRTGDPTPKPAAPPEGHRRRDPTRGRSPRPASSPPRARHAEASACSARSGRRHRPRRSPACARSSTPMDRRPSLVGGGRSTIAHALDQRCAKHVVFDVDLASRRAQRLADHRLGFHGGPEQSGRHARHLRPLLGICARPGQRRRRPNAPHLRRATRVADPPHQQRDSEPCRPR